MLKKTLRSTFLCAAGTLALLLFWNGPHFGLIQPGGPIHGRVTASWEKEDQTEKGSSERESCLRSHQSYCCSSRLEKTRGTRTIPVLDSLKK